jgi:hypothetical protein
MTRFLRGARGRGREKKRGGESQSADDARMRACP